MPGISFTVAVEVPKGINFEGRWDNCRHLGTPSPMNNILIGVKHVVTAKSQEGATDMRATVYDVAIS